MLWGSWTLGSYHMLHGRTQALQMPLEHGPEVTVEVSFDPGTGLRPSSHAVDGRTTEVRHGLGRIQRPALRILRDGELPSYDIGAKRLLRLPFVPDHIDEVIEDLVGRPDLVAGLLKGR